MQRSLSRPERLSLQSRTFFQSFKTFGLRSVGFLVRVSHHQAPGATEPGASNPSVRSVRQKSRRWPANDLPLQEPAMWKDLASVGRTQSTKMWTSPVTTTALCSYVTDVTRIALNRPVAFPGKPFLGILNHLQHRPARHWLSLQAQRGNTRKLFVRVADGMEGQDVLAKEGKSEFKRIVSERDSITTFYSSDGSSGSEVDEIMERLESSPHEEKKTIEDKAYEDRDSDGERREDSKKSKNVEALRKTENSKRRKMRGRESEEESDSGSENESGSEGEDGDKEQKGKQLNKLTIHKGEGDGKCEDSQSESEDEGEKKLRKEEKKATKGELQRREKFDKDTVKTIEMDEKKQKKEAKSFTASKKDQFDVDSGSDGDDGKKMKLNGKKKGILIAGQKIDEESDSDAEEDEQDKPKEMTKMLTKSKVTTKLASDSEYEVEDDGVTDLVDETLEIDEKEFEIVEDEILSLEIENELADKVEDELDKLDADDGFWDEEEGDVVAGDGGDGGGVVLEGTEWGKTALNLAEQVVAESGSDLSLFAFKVSPDGLIRVRLDKLSDRYGSPTMSDIEGFSKRFTIALEESGDTGTLPKDVDVEVSSPGAERVVRVPEDLERFKELPMYVQYVEGTSEPRKGTDQKLAEKEGVLELDSLDMDSGLSIWKIANVKLNREIKGRGRPLNSQQKKWRAQIPVASLKQIRLYLDV